MFDISGDFLLEKFMNEGLKKITLTNKTKYGEQLNRVIDCFRFKHDPVPIWFPPDGEMYMHERLGTYSKIKNKDECPSKIYYYIGKVMHDLRINDIVCLMDNGEIFTILREDIKNIFIKFEE